MTYHPAVSPEHPFQSFPEARDHVRQRAYDMGQHPIREEIVMGSRPNYTHETIHPLDNLYVQKHLSESSIVIASEPPSSSRKYDLKDQSIHPTAILETSDANESIDSRRPSSERAILEPEFPSFLDQLDSTESLLHYSQSGRRISEKPHQSQRRANKDEFDGPVQYLEKPSFDRIVAQERDLPHVPVSLEVSEQDRVLRQVNDQLSRCAFDFIAKYQFPIPIESDKRPVQRPSDREWTEWAFLIKRLATKRRIPARVLYNGQIKQLVTVLENSLEMRHASTHSSRPPKDDRNILQLISAGTQVAKMLKDATTMEELDTLYQHVEKLIRERRLQSPWTKPDSFNENLAGQRNTF